MKFKMKLSKWLKDKKLAEGVEGAILGLVKNPDEVYVERRFFAPIETEKGFESLKEGERAIIQYVSTRDLDRDNEILMPKGCDLSEFKKAPQVLWGHNYSMPPIGSDKWIKADDKGLLAKTEYAETPRGEEVWQLRKAGHLRTSSVGFIPLETTTPEKDDWKETCDELKDTCPEFKKVKDKVKRIIKKWLLLEHSDVSVPANINALTVAVAKCEIDLSDEIRTELNMPDIKAIKDELKKEMTVEVKLKDVLTKEQEEVIKKQAALEVEYENAEPCEPF